MIPPSLRGTRELGKGVRVLGKKEFNPTFTIASNCVVCFMQLLENPEVQKHRILQACAQ